MALGDRNSRIRLISPSWLDQIFGSGADGDLIIGQSLAMDLMKALDGSLLTRGCGLEFGVVGRSGHSEAELRGHKLIRSPDMTQNMSVCIYIGPELSKPPIAPPVSKTHALISELFSTALTCSLAVAGWVGTVSSVSAAGATGGLGAAATVYLGNASALATAQCVGGLVHTSLVLNGNETRANEMEANQGWKDFDRVADYVNFLGVALVGRDLLTVTRALQHVGLTIPDVLMERATAQQVATMSHLLELAKDADNLEGVAERVKESILATVLAGMGFYSSSRDSSGGFVQARDMLLGASTASNANQMPPGSQPAGSTTSMAAMRGAGLPTNSGARVPAPPIVNYMLRYRPDEVATISVLLLKKRGY